VLEQLIDTLDIVEPTVEPTVEPAADPAANPTAGTTTGGGPDQDDEPPAARR
jgi:hypothetical protein